MPRHADPERKPALIAQILDFLLDKPLSGLSFRTLARALDVSTFTLVYQFGTRAELLSEIVRAISSRETEIHQRLATNPGTIDVYFEGLVLSWDWTLDPRNRRLQRLEFEASMIEALDPASHTFVRSLYTRWQQIGFDALVSFGLSAEDADVESRLMVNTFYGIQYDLVVNNEQERATAAFTRAIQHHRERIMALIRQPA